MTAASYDMTACDNSQVDMLVCKQTQLRYVVTTINVFNRQLILILKK